MTTFNVIVFALAWYVLWGAAGYVHGRWYIRHMLSLAGFAPKFRPSAAVPALAFAYSFGGIAPMLYPPFLDAATESSLLFYSLLVIMALSLFPALLKFHAANEMAERFKRNTSNVTPLPVEQDHWWQSKAS